MGIYRGFISDIFHSARNTAMEVTGRMQPRLLESDFDDGDESPFVMYMFETPEDQRAAEANKVVALLRALTLSELQNLGCPKHILGRVEIRIFNRVEHREHSWVANR